MTTPELIDIDFNHWYNQAQPMKAIIDVVGPLPQVAVRNIKNQIKHAFTHGYARGVAAEAAKPLPDHPELGPVR
jgi:hypothetical protein